MREFGVNIVHRNDTSLCPVMDEGANQIIRKWNGTSY